MTPPQFEHLLAVQERDIELDQLGHRRRTHPARDALEQLAQERSALAAQRAEVAGRRDEVRQRQEELEADVAASERRIEQIDRRMMSGDVTASRDLVAMGDEIASIKKRVSGLEDEVLEAMEEREPLDSEVDALDERLAAIDARIAESADELRQAEVEIDATADQVKAARADTAAGVPAELLAAYERIRAKLGGVGAARLDGNRCTGCHLTLPATEVERLRHLPDDALAHCDQCGRILVR